MIVCHCMVISEADIRGAIDWMRAADPEVIITPNRVYRALGKRADCGGCLPLFVASMAKCDSYGVPLNLRGLGRAKPEDRTGEGRCQGHRVSQRRAAE
ncbi:MAG: (2Fe-2S)-binding protein [Rhodobacteraceae bacterium]|jgi:bacterioferritin-associated ferredoxin|nr:(2Fe-2S)-binding protein [Paracoccaceae bacterium]